MGRENPMRLPMDFLGKVHGRESKSHWPALSSILYLPSQSLLSCGQWGGETRIFLSSPSELVGSIHNLFYTNGVFVRAMSSSPTMERLSMGSKISSSLLSCRMKSCRFKGTKLTMLRAI